MGSDILHVDFVPCLVSMQVHKRVINDAASTHWVDLCRRRAFAVWIQSTRGAKDKAAKKLIALHYVFSQSTGTLCANRPQRRSTSSDSRIAVHGMRCMTWESTTCIYRQPWSRFNRASLCIRRCCPHPLAAICGIAAQAQGQAGSRNPGR